MEPTPISPKAYNDFLARVQPREIRLVRANSSAPSPYTGGTVEASVELGDTRYENTEEGFRVWQTARLTGSSAEIDEPVIVIEAEFEVVYSSEESITSEIFSVFQRLNLPVNTWPYLREFFQQTTLRSGWPAFVLPAFQTLPQRKTTPEEERSS